MKDTMSQGRCACVDEAGRSRFQCPSGIVAKCKQITSQLSFCRANMLVDTTCQVKCVDPNLNQKPSFYAGGVRSSCQCSIARSL